MTLNDSGSAGIMDVFKFIKYSFNTFDGPELSSERSVPHNSNKVVKNRMNKLGYK